MDSVELARQVAAELHARLVAAGADPWSPYDFAVAEAKRRGIDVEPTAAGAAVLNGGRATFVAADDLIIHENAGSRFEQAFLVAHEIGHVELGDDPDGGRRRRRSIRPARPSRRRSAWTGLSTMDAGNAARSRWTCSRASCCFPAASRARSMSTKGSPRPQSPRSSARRSRSWRSSFSTLCCCRRCPPTAEATHVERPLNPLQAAAARASR